jgi:hypothetical protein
MSAIDSPIAAGATGIGVCSGLKRWISLSYRYYELFNSADS